MSEHQTRLQSALEHYSRALRTDPEDRMSFAALAGLYFALHDFDRALAVVAEGIHHLEPAEKTAASLEVLYTIRARIAWFRNDEKSHLAALDSAVQVGGGAQPALYFELGLAYLRARSSRSVPPSALSRLAPTEQLAESPQKALGARWLKSFSSRWCRGKMRERFDDLCMASEGEIIRLHAEGIGWDRTTPPTAKPQ